MTRKFVLLKPERQPERKSLVVNQPKRASHQEDQWLLPLIPCMADYANNNVGGPMRNNATYSRQFNQSYQSGPKCKATNFFFACGKNGHWPRNSFERCGRLRPEMKDRILN